jgi:hypothetical protein
MKIETIEAEMLAAFNEQQVIEGDDDLQTDDPENALFRYWLSQRTDVSEVSA